jgi:hypothetical protein
LLSDFTLLLPSRVAVPAHTKLFNMSVPSRFLITGAVDSALTGRSVDVDIPPATTVRAAKEMIVRKWPTQSAPSVKQIRLLHRGFFLDDDQATLPVNAAQTDAATGAPMLTIHCVVSAAKESESKNTEKQHSKSNRNCCRIL